MTKPSAKERILDTAGRLFYQHGFQAIGVDTITAESNVAKMTLYRHFASKDDLIVAYLEHSNHTFWTWIDSEVADIDDPKDQLIAIFDAVETLTTRPQCLGCTFQTTAAEFPDPNHPAHVVAAKHKKECLERFSELASAAALRDPESLSQQLMLLMDGAWVAVRMFGKKNNAAAVGDAARALIAAREN